jgi:hypothetical protein
MYTQVCIYIMLCISRITNETLAQHFGDGRHKFYLELRCNNTCVIGKSVCTRCIYKSATKAVQTVRTFDHGNVNEPISEKSHIFGGQWYLNGIKKWGAPSSDVINFAIEYQMEARSEFACNNKIESTSKDILIDNTQDMPRGKKKEIETNDGAAATVEKPVVKRKRKPLMSPINIENKVDETEHAESSEPKKAIRKKPTLARKKPAVKSSTPTSYCSTKDYLNNPLVNPDANSFRDACIPTHIEKEFDTVDTSDYRIQYITLTLFEHKGTEYYRDSKKNKIYKKLKDKQLGAYVGRYYQKLDEIDTAIPDSDDEK